MNNSKNRKPQSISPKNIVRNEIVRVTENKVMSGPFKGMQFYSDLFPSKYLLGTYEKELYSLINKLCKKSFDTIVNIGAELGYYAVGFAIRNPKALVIAFEKYNDWHSVILQLAQKNGVEERVVVKGLCTINSLAASIKDSGKCLLFVDCEGGEKTLLDPQKIPGLKKCNILVELHEFKYRNLSPIIEKRFQATHKIYRFSSRERNFFDLPGKFWHSFRNLSLWKYYVASMDEKRPEKMHWYYLEKN